MVQESGILNKLDKGDGVMEYRGFLEEARQRQGIELHKPFVMRTTDSPKKSNLDTSQLLCRLVQKEQSAE